MYIFGVILLALGAFLLVVFSPWIYLDTRGATGLMDFTELFWYAQWTGFWLSLGALLCFDFSFWRAPFAFTQRAAIAPGIAAGLVILFIAFAMPEASNQREWYKGALGFRVYLRTKIRLAADARGPEALPSRFTGTWKSGRDPIIQIGSESVSIRNGAAHIVISEQTCPHRFHLEYRLTPPSGLFEYFRNATATEEDFRRLSNHDYPLLIADCGMDSVALVLLEPKKLLVLSRNASPQILHR